jgi:hypothetical protein
MNMIRKLATRTIAATFASRDIFLNMPEEVCEERIRFADAIARARREVHVARAEQAHSVSDGATLTRGIA